MTTAAQRSSLEDAPPQVTVEEQKAQIQKILHSGVFRPAPAIQKFLEYVGFKAIEGLSNEIKEFTIGIEVFERPSDYDPRIDTVVRVQAHRLREKLKEYYDSEGAGDDVLVAIPKGHYVPHFSRRALPGRPSAQSPLGLRPVPKTTDPTPPSQLGIDVAPVTRHEPRLGDSFWIVGGLVAIILLLGAGLVLPRLVANHVSPQATHVQANTSTAASFDNSFTSLWGDFLKDQGSPIVAYSNAVFLVTDTSDLLRLKSEEVDNLGAFAGSNVANKLVANPKLLEHAGPVFFEDIYTGTGEVMAVYYLTRMFGELHTPLEVKRSRLVTTDDLANHNLIFLGSTRENALLAGLPLSQDFDFQWPAGLKGVWSGKIVNVHPQSGEPSTFEVERDPKTRVLRADYALVSIQPGIAPNRQIAILGGLTTLGTQAAAEYASTPANIAELASHLGTGTPRRIPPYFQAVLRVEIMKGDILSVKFVAGHATHPIHTFPKN